VKPPAEMTEPLEVDPSLLDDHEMEYLLTGLIVPRAIGWISTISKDGIVNLAPFSFFTVAATEPPHLAISCGGSTKDTLVNSRETGEFVANIPDRSLIDFVVGSSAAVAPSVNEFELVGLESLPSKRVKPPRVALAKAHLECVVRQIVPVGTSFLIIGEIVHVHCEPSIWERGRVRPELLHPVARLGGSYYATLGEIFSRPAPTINERGGRSG
jgi:flavin reductase (DIM6/NTAB) family NADH-FMN oxidoreductase RutF